MAFTHRIKTDLLRWDIILKVHWRDRVSHRIPISIALWETFNIISSLSAHIQPINIAKSSYHQYLLVKIPILSIIRYSRNEYWNKANERKWQDSYCERQNHRWKSFCQFYFFRCGWVEFWNYLSLIRRHAFKCYPPLFALNQSNYHLTLLPYCIIESWDSSCNTKGYWLPR